MGEDAIVGETMRARVERLRTEADGIERICYACFIEGYDAGFADAVTRPDMASMADSAMAKLKPEQK